MSVITETARQRGRIQSLVEAAESSSFAAAALDQVEEGNTTQAVIALVHELHAITLTLEAAIAPTEPHRDHTPEIDDGWYAIELMGHRARLGHVRTVPFGGRQMIEITEPAHPVGDPKQDPDGDGHDGREVVSARVEYYAPAAVFSLRPSTEEQILADLAERDGDIPF
jgi:hypothetical protein